MRRESSTACASPRHFASKGTDARSVIKLRSFNSSFSSRTTTYCKIEKNESTQSLTIVKGCLSVISPDNVADLVFSFPSIGA